MLATENDSKWLTTLMGEVLVLKLLGRLLYEEPNKDWLQTLLAEDVFDEIPFGAEQDETKLGIELIRKSSGEKRSKTPEEWFENLQVDHTRLFIGTGKVLAAPWESVHLSKGQMLFQEQTLQVRAWYRRFGLEPEKLHQEPDDHIGLELAFVSQLASLALEKLEAGDQPGFEEALQAQRDFLSEHLLRWAPAFVTLVEQYAQTDFYRGLAHLTYGALLAAAAMLGIKMSEQAGP